MFTLIAANAQILNIGMEHFVFKLFHALVEEFMIQVIIVYALINIIGIKGNVYFHHALVVRFGKELDVYVQLVLISMVLCVFNVSMVKYGNKS